MAVNTSHGTAHETVLLIGASRGLGLALAEEYARRGSQVVATVRGSGPTALHEVQAAASGRIEIEHVDITSQQQVLALRQRLAPRQFDLLFVNAGVINGPEESTGNVRTEEFTRLMLTNALSPMRVVETLVTLINPSGTVVVMSSVHGSIANNERGEFEIYRASKAALNQLMRSYSARHRADTRTLILMAPGWVKTALGGPHAPLTVADSIPKVVQTVDAQHGHGGLQFLDYLGRPVAW